MESIKNLKGLMILELRKLYNAEKQQLNALPKIQDMVLTPLLKSVIQNHKDETKKHITRLEEIFKELDESAYGEVSEPMQKLIQDCYKRSENSLDAEVADAAIIVGLQYIEHFEICGYGTVYALVNELDLSNIADKLSSTLDEEKKFDFRLTQLAIQEDINEKARITVLYD